MRARLRKLHIWAPIRRFHDAYPTVEFAISVAAGLAAQLSNPEFGGSADVGLYAALAQVIPVLLLTLMVEASGMGLREGLRSIREDLAEQPDRVREVERSGDQVLVARAKEQGERLERLRVSAENSVREARRFVRTCFGSAIVAEAACFVAIGENKSTSFLLTIAVFHTGILTITLLRMYELRMGSLDD